MGLKFRELKDSTEVSNKKGDILGYISYYKKWKCYVWEQMEDVIMSEDCLEEVVKKMKEKKNEKPFMLDEAGITVLKREKNLQAG